MIPINKGKLCQSLGYKHAPKVFLKYFLFFKVRLSLLFTKTNLVAQNPGKYLNLRSLQTQSRAKY